MMIEKWFNRAYKVNEAIKCISEAEIPVREKSILNKRLKLVKKEILEVVKKIEEPSYQLFIVERYLNFKTWREIADLFNCSEKWAMTGLRRKVLSEAEEVFNNEKNKSK